MSQKSVLDFLEKNKGKWFTTKEIALKIGIGNSACTNNLSKLMKYNLIKRKNDSQNPMSFKYSFNGDIYFKNRYPKLPEETKEDERNKFIEKRGR